MHGREVTPKHVRWVHRFGHLYGPVSDRRSGRARYRAIVATEAQGCVRAQDRRGIGRIHHRQTVIGLVGSDLGELGVPQRSLGDARSSIEAAMRSMAVEAGAGKGS